ncbi:DUF2971 domain-containing protein [Mucilaginibacter sp. L3T2-6]|uniref:DUF2971 domain-containing protein n=1 Tax=Mucilaginibacter sp. L3T2-6 TaxID=3062491 RepID=UPI0026771FEF|nr:DUF2971 domain-containing protein [Mucilaginibacter sp. L3T2-6]MDO3643845.1 DUF2971 domain-containing protein [Mucilaginibacter sp. L3T2-6]MDV6216296.1 DUF2971 domain-containing protein [Mucilaginibacter sp. L3T2-6]
MNSSNQLVQEFLPNGLPPKLYKFSQVNSFLHQSLSKNYLWHSRRADFNDPYDCYSRLLKYEPSREQLIEYARRTLLPGESLSEITSYMVNNPEIIVEAYLKTADKVIGDMGICCFTTNCNNILMWSHYAHNHKGVCLVFNPYKDINSFLVAKVRYLNEFRPINYFDDPTTNAMIMYTTKSKDWEYEEEYRLVNASNGAVFYDKQALIEIIFGCKCSQADMLAVISSVASSGHNDITYLKAEMQEESFSLSFRTSPWLNA